MRHKHSIHSFMLCVLIVIALCTKTVLALGAATLGLCRYLIHGCGLFTRHTQHFGGFMSSLRHLFIIGFVLLFMSNSTLVLAQDAKTNSSQEARSNGPSAPTITAAFSAGRIRFTALGEVEKLRLEVFSKASELLFDSGFQPGSIRDWSLKDQQGQALAEGSYLCVITVKDLSGNLRVKQRQILLQAGQASLQLADPTSTATPDPDSGFATVADSSRQGVTVLAHDGKDGQLVSTSGALSFRLGNLFAGTDKEMVRLTPEGNFGIGFTRPQARLDVDGVIRTSQGILFPDGTMQFSAASKTFGAPSSRSGQMGSGGQGLQPQTAGSGTLNVIAKWIDSVGTLGNSILFESAGKIGVGTGFPSATLDVWGIINTSTQYNIDGQKVLSTPATNLFIGLYAGSANTTGAYNTFSGLGAGLSNTTGTHNSFYGYSAGSNTTTGIHNSFYGTTAGFNNTTGAENSFFGTGAGQSNSTGGYNSFFGTIAGSSNSAGSDNSFFGYIAGAGNSTGNDNSFFGKDTGRYNTTGSFNSFFGSAAGFNHTTGMHNTFIGYGADFNSGNPTGNDNTLLGYNTKVTSGVSNSTAIGANAQTTTSNTIVLGTSSETVIVRGKLQVDTLGNAGSQQLCLNGSSRLAPCSSSLRYKSDLRPFTGGLSLLNRLQPISFTWKDGGLHDVGFGAEEVEKIEPLLVNYNATGQVEGVKYDRLTVVLVNALKEQQQQLAAQQTQITELHSTKAENSRLKAQLAEMLARLERLEKTRSIQQ